MRMFNEILVKSFVGLNHRRHVKLCSCPLRGCQPQGLPKFSISQERCHRIGKTLNISRLHDKALPSALEEVWHAAGCGAHNRQTDSHGFHHREGLPSKSELSTKTSIAP